MKWKLLLKILTWIVHNIKHAEAGKILPNNRPRIYTYNEKGERL